MRTTRRTRSRGHRILVASTMALLVGLLGVPSGASATSPARSGNGVVEPPMDFKVDTFPLRDLAPSKLPFLDYPIPQPHLWQPTDADGIKMRWWGGKLYYHPVELGLLAMRLLAGYQRTGNREFLDWAERYAAKIRQISIESDGALFVPYRFYYANERLQPPWFSGMSQGIILGAFVRLHRFTGKPSYGVLARKLFASFQRSGPSDRPWVVRVSPYRFLWIEEYPRNDRHDRVLNGFMYAVYGLYEYWQHTGRPAARRVLEGALTTLRTNVHVYRVPGGVSFYCLYHKTRWPKYHLVHIKQLRFMAAMSGDAFFSRTADLWERDYDGTSA